MRKKFSRTQALLSLSLFMVTFAFVAMCGLGHAVASSVRIQLCMVMDGSDSINSTEWSLIVQAVSKGVADTIPHDGSIEFTVVQFGYSNGLFARTELAPTVINDTTFSVVANHVLSIQKMGGSTPTVFGVYLGWQEMRSSLNFGTTTRQVINLATDSIPTDSVRNDNATSDLDGNGHINGADDLIAVVNGAVDQGLDELDIEGINLKTEEQDWFRNWVIRPQPGVIAPPFSKAGWIRFVADVPEFANTLGQKLTAIITGRDIWTPGVIGAFLTSIIIVSVTTVVSTLASGVSNPETFPSQAIVRKINEALPDTLKKWLHEFISAKRKAIINPRSGPPFTVTKLEVASYIISLSVLTFAFSYVKTSTFDQILTVIPTVLATSIIVEFVKSYVIVVVARTQGVWTEHRLWYFGLTMFAFSSMVFKVPFSSPSRLTHNSPKFTTRSLGLVAAAQVIIPIAFSAVFYGLFTSGFTLIGNIGIVMCLTMAFFDSIPIPPINGKDIYDWSKILWMALFITTFTLYMLALFVL
jgi:hypothetical protein